MTKPEKEDIVDPMYTENVSDTKNYFDTWVSLERAGGVTSTADITTKGKSASWKRYDSNDDSGELPAQPSGSKYNVNAYYKRSK